MPVKKFPKEVLKALIGEDDDGFEGKDLTVISDDVVDNSRWSVIHHLFFKHGDKIYFTDYSVGATESQYEPPFEYASAQVPCVEMEPYQVTVTQYRPVPNVKQEVQAVQGPEGSA